MRGQPDVVKDRTDGRVLNTTTRRDHMNVPAKHA
jgi:hypothetical protein